MNNNYFKFYVIDHNEDADPYIQITPDSGIMAIADGLGGSGASVHRLEPRLYEKLEKRLKETVLPEFFRKDNYVPDDDIRLCRGEVIDCGEDCARRASAKIKDDVKQDFEEWLYGLLKPMADEEPDTSAFWGSRIAIARCIHYMLTHGDAKLSKSSVRRDLVEYVYDGIRKTRTAFGLKTAGLGRQAVLPTTLVLMRYKTENDGQILTEVIWAGDSRAYAMIPEEGLRQLTTDDEDASGSVTNIFGMSDEGSCRDTKLNYAAYRLPKGSGVFICSDGVFDPFSPADNAGVNAAFLRTLREADSFADWRRKLADYYTSIKSDDITVAFAVPGCRDFLKFREIHTFGCEDMIAASDNYMKWKSERAIVNGTVENPTDYIRERLLSRKSRVAQLIADSLLSSSDEPDPIITQKILDYCEDTGICPVKNSYGDPEAKKLKLSEKLRKILETPQNVSRVFRNTDCTKELAKLSQAAGEVTDAEAAQVKCTDDLSTAKEVREGLIADGAVIAEKINERIRQLEERKDALSDIRGSSAALCDEISAEYGRTNKAETITRHSKTVADFYTSLIDAVDRHIASLRELIRFWNERDTAKGFNTPNVDLCHEDKHFRDEIDDLISTYKEAKKNIHRHESDLGRRKKAVREAAEAYGRALPPVSATICAAIDSPEEYLVPEIAEELGLIAAKAPSDVNSGNVSDAIENLIGSDPSVVDELVCAIASNEATAIDSVFTGSRLAQARLAGTVDPEKIKANERLIADFVSATDDVSAYVVTISE